jgi:molybdopterin molybdotransferase
LKFSSHSSPPAVSFAEACSIVEAHAGAILSQNRFEAEYCDLTDCLGRILAAPLLADRDQPPFPRVTRDGFAVRAQDVASGIPLRLAGQLRAGEVWPANRSPLQPGEAMEIMTGTPLPPGADAVLMVEHVQEPESSGEDAATTAQPFAAIVPEPDRTLQLGENVVPRGSEARRGQVLIEPGARLGPDAIGLAASCGQRSLQVYRPPAVAILATGDEIVELAASGGGSQSAQPELESHQIYDSNSHALAALVKEAHAIPLLQPSARDRKDDLSARIRHARSVAPLLLLTGGVSMGRYDLVEDVLAEIGAEFFFRGVRIQPGKPVIFGRLASADAQSRYFFGLPGNPVSTMVTFRLFVQPLLAAMAGERRWQPKIALAELATDVQRKPGLTRFLPARLDTAATLNPTVTLVPTQGSGDLAANARANCYVICPDVDEAMKAGQVARVLLR